MNMCAFCQHFFDYELIECGTAGGRRVCSTCHEIFHKLITKLRK